MEIWNSVYQKSIDVVDNVQNRHQTLSFNVYLIAVRRKEDFSMKVQQSLVKMCVMTPVETTILTPLMQERVLLSRRQTMMHPGFRDHWDLGILWAKVRTAELSLAKSLEKDRETLVYRNEEIETPREMKLFKNIDEIGAKNFVAVLTKVEISIEIIISAIESVEGALKYYF